MQKILAHYHFSSLRFRLFSFLGGILAIMLFIMIASVFVNINNVEQISWQERQSEAAQNAALTVQAFLHEIEKSLEVMVIFGGDTIQTHPDILYAFLEKNPVFIELVYIDHAGKIIANASHEQPLIANLFTIPQSEWFRRALTGEQYYSRVQISADDKAYVLYSIPVLPNPNQPSSPYNVLVARIQMDLLSKVVSNIRFGESGHAYIVNQQGQIIAHSNPQIALGISSINDNPQLQKIILAPAQSWYGNAQSLTGERVLVASAMVEPRGWIVITELPTSEAFANSRRAAGNLLLQLVSIVIVVMILLIRGFNRLVLQPIDLLRNGALRLGEGDLDHIVPILSQDELGEVTFSFNDMAARLKAEKLALRTANEVLENRVRERTSELTRLNLALSHEVTVRTQAEQQVRASLQEKEILLKEIHHRVKNNLQIISSLLNMQSRKVQDLPTLAALQESQNRVRSMSLIHEKLYLSGNLAQINLGEYVKTLATYLSRSYQPAGQIAITIQTLPPGHPFDAPFNSQCDQPPEILLDLDEAVPCGLMLNELISNAFKYAFPDGRQGKILITLQHTDDSKVIIRVADDGIGFPTAIDLENISQFSSLGLQLVKGLVEQLEGQLEFKTDLNAGTCYTVQFPG